MSKILILPLIILISVCTVFAQTESESGAFSYPLKLYNQAFYDLAAQQFVKFYNSYPNSQKVDEAKYYAGMSFFKLSNYNQARIEFQSLALEYPQSNRVGESWFKAALCYENLGNYPEAAKAYETIRLLYPEDPYAPQGLYHAGLLYLKMNKSAEAFRTFTFILERYASSAYYYKAMVKAGRSLFNMNELQKAKEMINKVFDGQAEAEVLSESNLLLAQIEYSQGYFDAAKENFLKVLDKAKTPQLLTEATIELSKIYIQENDFKSAQQYLSRAIDQQSEALILQELHYLLGDVYFLDDKLALAEKEYAGTSFSGSDSLNLIINLKQALARKKQDYITDAAEILGKALRNHPQKNERLYNRLSDIHIDWLVKSKQYQAAISMLYGRINSKPVLKDRIPLTLRLVKILEKLEQWRAVIRELQPFLLIQEKYPEKDDVLFYLAVAHRKIDDYEESAYFFEELYKEFSASPYYVEAEKQLNYLKEYKIAGGDLAVNQLKLIGKLLENESRSDLQFELGKIYFSDLKYFNLAEVQFKAAMSAGSEILGDIYLYLGKTYLKMAGNHETENYEVIDYLKKARDQFKSAVENIKTCSKPDEAAWLMIKTTIGVDTVRLHREKQIIEKLIADYPKSSYLEEWHESLAFALSFNSEYTGASIGYFEKLLAEYKDSEHYPAYLFGYAQLIKYKQPEKALDLYKTIASEYPFSDEADQALMNVADYYYKKNMFKEAGHLFERFLNYYYYADNIAEVKQKLAHAYLKSGSFEQAIKLLEQQIDSPFITDQVLAKEFLTRSLYDHIYLLAEAYRGSGDADRAQAFFNLYLNLDLKGNYRGHARFALGELYYETGQKKVAIENFRAISKSDSALYLQARIYTAKTHFDLKDYKQAAAVYRELIQILEGTDKEYEVFGKYIISLLRAGQIEESKNQIALYKRAFSDKKDYLAQFVLELGRLQRMQKNFDKANNYFNEVKKKYKSTEYVDDADYYLALNYITLNKNDDAFEILSNFYTNYPQSDQLPAALNTLGTLYFRSEKFDSAIEMFKNALKYCKEKEQEQNILSNLIKTYTFTGFWDAAQGTARQYVEKFPGADDKIDKKIIIAQAYINLNQFQSAVDYLRKIKLEADSEKEPEIQYYIGEALLKAGRYEEAIAEFVKIPLLSKKTKLQWEASALYYSGQSYEKLGRVQDAIRMYREIIRRPGIDLVLKKEAEKRIKQIQ